jgi:hypothetical protein
MLAEPLKPKETAVTDYPPPYPRQKPVPDRKRSAATVAGVAVAVVLVIGGLVVLAAFLFIAAAMNGFGSNK